MKIAFCNFLGVLCAISHLLHAAADIGDEIYNENTLTANSRKRPYTIEAAGDAIQKAKIKKGYLDDQSIAFRIVDVDANAVVYYEPCYGEALILGLGYNNTQFIWKENPFFKETVFRNVDLTIGAASERLNNWLWKGLVTFNLDADHTNWNLYASYELMLWGRYAYRTDLGVHAGFLAQTGMKIDHVYPIIGFDWQISPTWQLNVVYPVDISLEYTWNCFWSFEIAGRFFDHRQRVGKSEPLSQGLWTYRSSGVELGVNYENNTWLVANIHAGSTISPKVTIANHSNEDKRHFKLKDSYYLGGSCTLSF